MLVTRCETKMISSKVNLRGRIQRNSIPIRGNQNIYFVDLNKFKINQKLIECSQQMPLQVVLRYP